VICITTLSGQLRSLLFEVICGVVVCQVCGS